MANLQAASRSGSLFLLALKNPLVTLGVLLGLAGGVAALCMRRVDTGVPAICSKLNDLRLKEKVTCIFHNLYISQCIIISQFIETQHNC